MKTITKSKWLGTTLVLAVLLTSSCTYQKEREQLQEQANQLEQELHARDSAFNELMTVMTQVETQIEKIKEQENIISTQTGDFKSGNGEKMVSDLGIINELIGSTNEMIRDLSKKLENSDMELNAFRKKVKTIEKDLRDREESLSLLRQEVAMKDQKIESLETEVQKLFNYAVRSDSTIEAQRGVLREKQALLDKNTLQINRAFFAVDSELNLKQDGLISKEGGFLGIGKTTELQPDAVQGNFTEVDINFTTKFYIDSDKAEVVTEHPSDSYKMVIENNRVQYLEVTDPESFWRISKYLVVSTKS